MIYSVREDRVINGDSIDSKLLSTMLGLAAEIEAELILSGEMIPPVDIMIAAIALQNKEAVLTRNSKHFERISGLEVKTY